MCVFFNTGCEQIALGENENELTWTYFTKMFCQKIKYNPNFTLFFYIKHKQPANKKNIHKYSSTINTFDFCQWHSVPML